uniref:Uncharacterized protein n=1 Tax=Arion vulgaris TaxID=1028688 RepID=A0A0B7A9Q0_9EUPU
MAFRISAMLIALPLATVVMPASLSTLSFSLTCIFGYENEPGNIYCLQTQLSCLECNLMTQ